MKTFIIDWGKGATGARYALIQAKNLNEAWWDADQIGAPFAITELKIPYNEDDGCRYMEISSPKKRYSGCKISDIKFMRSRAIGPAALLPEASLKMIGHH